jgi:hypothetical protein
MRVSDKKETSKPDRGIITVQRSCPQPARRARPGGDTELMIERRK